MTLLLNIVATINSFKEKNIADALLYFLIQNRNNKLKKNTIFYKISTSHESHQELRVFVEIVSLLNNGNLNLTACAAEKVEIYHQPPPPPP